MVQSAGGSAERRVLALLHSFAASARAAGLGSPAVVLVGKEIGELMAALYTSQARVRSYACRFSLNHQHRGTSLARKGHRGDGQYFADVNNPCAMVVYARHYLDG